VGGDRSAGKASPLTWRRLPKRCLGASTDAPEKTDRAWVAARRTRWNVRQTRADTRRDRAPSMKTHPKRIFGTRLRLRGHPGHYALGHCAWSQPHFLTARSQTVAPRWFTSRHWRCPN
jgi:hypothetical protein